MKRASGALAVGAACVVVAACGGDDGGGSASGGSSCDEPYRIGVMLGLTGVYAAVAEPQKQTLDLFAEQIKADGGINGREVQFTTVDTRSDEAEAVNLTRRLATQDNVHAIVGPSSSGEAIAMKPIVESLKVPTMAIAASNAIIESPASYAFKEFPSSTDSLRAQLTHLKDTGRTKVAMLYSNNAYGQEPADDLDDVADELGLEVTASEAFPADATNVTSQLSAVADSSPDAILVWAVLPGPAVVAENAQSLGLDVPLFMAPGAASGAYLELAGDAADGTLVQGSKILVPDDIPKGDPQREVVTEYASAFQERYDEPAGQFGGGAWDSMLLMVTALEQGDVNPCGDVQEARDAIRTSLETNIQELPGTVATYSFSAEQHGPSGIEGQAVLKVQGGKFALEDGT